MALDCKTYLVNYLLVGGGGGGGGSYYCNGGGGGGGEVCFGLTVVPQCFNVVVGSGGVGCYNVKSCNGGASCLWWMRANGGLGGCGERTGGSGNKQKGGIPGGYYCCGCGGAGAGTGAYYCNGGFGIQGYGGGGNGGMYYSCPQSSIDGGGLGMRGGYGAGQNATNYGGGGGGGNYSKGGDGCQGVVDICYKTDGSYGFTCATGGNSCYTCDGLCVHRFTSSGTFTIVS